MPAIVDRQHNTLSRGKDLAVVLNWARKHPVEVIRVDYYAVNEGRLGNYAVTFYFDCKGRIPTSCLTYWGDWRVLLTWLLARRSWAALHRLRFAHPGTFELAHADVRAIKLRERGVSICGPQHAAPKDAD